MASEGVISVVIRFLWRSRVFAKASTASDPVRYFDFIPDLLFVEEMDPRREFTAVLSEVSATELPQKAIVT